MEDMKSVRRSLWTEEEGVTAIEYALIAALIAIVIVAAVPAAGQNLLLLYNNVAGALANV